MLAYNKILTVVLATACFFFRESLTQNNEGDVCTDNSGQSGICTPFGDCEELISNLDSGAKPFICGIPEQTPIVCCPTGKSVTHEKQSNSKSLQKCMEYAKMTPRANNASSSRKSVPAIIGGYLTRPAEFPHMAALGYGEENNISWLCGGSLISERFVLTAAHCLATHGKGLVRWVRLGDTNLKRTDDGAEAQQFFVEHLYRHPDYQPPARYNDIGLLKLDRSVKFTASVRPACIHAQETLPSTRPEAIGWGLTEWGTSRLSDDLMKVDLNFIDMEYCNRTYAPLVGGKKLNRGIDEQTMLCVGDLEGGKDTCQGDSGGPLHVHLENKTDVFDIIGITSFGNACGSRTSPAIYTRVSYFVPWIESIVWP